MKKFLIKCALCFTLLFNFIVVNASDTAHNSGYGCTLNGSIYDQFISASVTGTGSSNYNIELRNGYYYDTAGNYKRANTISSITYINLFGSSVDRNFFKWDKVDVKAKNSNTGYEIKLRTLIN